MPLAAIRRSEKSDGLWAIRLPGRKVEEGQGMKYSAAGWSDAVSVLAIARLIALPRQWMFSLRHYF